jgi:menaquinone-dependent protoporphyrinogen oxidase
MKSLIVYCSSHGTTERAAQILRESLAGEVTIVDLKKKSVLDLASFDVVVIGGSIHAGNIQRKVKQFIQDQLPVLLTKKVGLFLCCMHEGEQANLQFEQAFPKELREKSLSNGLFGGEFNFARMNFLERQIVKKVAGVKEDKSTFNEAIIHQFAEQLNAAPAIQ